MSLSQEAGRNIGQTRRVLIVGNSGGGKSTLARALGAKLSLPVVHLDVLFWKPGWVESERAAFRQTVAQALREPAWIMDGNFSGTWDMRMPAADTIVWINQPWPLSLWRAIHRMLTDSPGRRLDMAEGCAEKFDFKFYRCIWTWDARVRPRLEAALAEHAAAARLVRLRSDREIAEFLASAA